MTTGAIRRLLTTFLILFLILSGVAAYVQIFNQAFINGPALAHGSYDPRICPPYDTPIRGTIFDRNGVKLAWTVQDPKSQPCGYRREYDPRVRPPVSRRCSATSAHTTAQRASRAPSTTRCQVSSMV